MSYTLDWLDRAGISYLRLTSEKRRNGVRLFVLQPLAPNVSEEVVQQTEKLLVKKLASLENRRSK